MFYKLNNKNGAKGTNMRNFWSGTKEFRYWIWVSWKRNWSRMTVKSWIWVPKRIQRNTKKHTFRWKSRIFVLRQIVLYTNQKPRWHWINEQLYLTLHVLKTIFPIFHQRLWLKMSLVILEFLSSFFYCFLSFFQFYLCNVSYLFLSLFSKYSQSIF